MMFESELLRAFNSDSYWPRPDIAICADCGWRGAMEKCDTKEEGDWESGYYKVCLCPKCEDGGCLDALDYSIKQRIRLWWWGSKHRLKNRSKQTDTPRQGDQDDPND